MQASIPGPAYRIETKRLAIRCWNPADALLLETAIAESLDHLRPWMPWAMDEPAELQTRIDRLRRFRGEFDLGQDFIYAIFDPQDTRVLGGTGLHLRAGPEAREIGYWIHQDFTNQGLATEATAALTKVAFVIDRVERVEIRCDPANVASAAVPNKLGFVHEATLRRRDLTPQGQPRDTMVWTLLSDEFPASPAAAVQFAAFDAAGRKIL